MDQVSFQNGFVCGMTAKGLVRSGELFKPTIWNDSGAYSYFYIDFRRMVQEFSLGMFNESVIVYDSQQVAVTRIEKTGTMVYKIYCDITNKIHGITVLNKKTTRLRFATGELMPVFSVHMFVSGQVPYIDGGYVYEYSKYALSIVNNISEPTPDISFCDSIIPNAYSEQIDFVSTSVTATDSPTIVLK